MAHTNTQHPIGVFDGPLSSAPEAFPPVPFPDDWRAVARCIPRAFAT